MNNEREKYELIEQYLKRELTVDDLSIFEAKLKENPSLAEDVKSHQIIHELIIDQGLLDLKQRMKAYERQQDSGRGTRSVIIYSIVVIAFLSTLVFYWSQNTAHEPQKQVNQEKATDDKPLVTAKKNFEQPRPRKKIDNGGGTQLPESTSLPAAPIDIPVKEENSQATVDDLKSHENSISPDKQAAVRENESIVNKKEEKSIVCQLENSLLKLTITESCVDTPTGAIAIDKSSSFAGEQPIEFSIDGKNYTPSDIFATLPAGSYDLSLRDASGCSWIYGQEIIVGEKNCREKEYSFFPSRGEVWEFPIPDYTSIGKIEIYNKNGGLVFKSFINNGQPSSWNGLSDGQELPMGSYTFLLTMNGKVTQGFVTIFR